MPLAAAAAAASVGLAQPESRTKGRTSNADCALGLGGRKTERGQSLSLPLRSPTSSQRAGTTPRIGSLESPAFGSRSRLRPPSAYDPMPMSSFLEHLPMLPSTWWGAINPRALNDVRRSGASISVSQTPTRMLSASTTTRVRRLRLCLRDPHC